MATILDGDEMVPLTPAVLAVMAEAASKLRTDALFGIKDEDATDPVAEQHYLLALSFLETAAHHFTLAKLAQERSTTTKQ